MIDENMTVPGNNNQSELQNISATPIVIGDINFITPLKERPDVVA
jgi:hypothetical protein